jgi:hypothetical protein
MTVVLLIINPVPLWKPNIQYHIVSEMQSVSVFSLVLVTSNTGRELPLEKLRVTEILNRFPSIYETGGSSTFLSPVVIICTICSNTTIYSAHILYLLSVYPSQ